MKKVLLSLVILLAAMTQVQAQNFHVTSDGPVTGYFISQSADYTNILVPTFDGLVGPALGINNHTSYFGQSFNFGNFSSGTSVIFEDIVVDTGDTWYSKVSMNADGFDHLFYSAFTLPGGVSALVVGFEDLRLGGDRDFNDVVAVFTNVSPVPEPHEYLMMLIGLIVVFTVVKNNKAREDNHDNLVQI